MEVDRRGLQVLMAEQALNGAERDTELEKVGGVAMTQGVNGGDLLKAKLFPSSLEGLLEGGWMERLAGGFRDEEVSRSDLGSVLLPALTKTLQPCRWEWHRAVAPSLAIAEPDEAALGVDTLPLVRGCRSRSFMSSPIRAGQLLDVTVIPQDDRSPRFMRLPARQGWLPRGSVSCYNPAI